MNTLHLNYVLEVERTRSISRAAENLFMAQPNLSKAIQELEKSLGITIFERTSKGVVPTSQGMEFISYAKKILSDVEKMQKIRDAEEAFHTKISVPRGSYVSSAFAKFVSKIETSHISIDFKETNSMETILNVSEKGYNFGIIRYPVSNEKYFLDYLKEKSLSYEEMWKFESCVITNKGGKFKNGDSIKLSDLADMIELAHGDNIVPYVAKLINTPEKTKNKRINFYERGSQFELLKFLPNSYVWVAPVPERTLENFDLVQLKCKEGNAVFKDVLIYKKDYTFTKTEQIFLELLKSERNELAKTYNA